MVDPLTTILAPETEPLAAGEKAFNLMVEGNDELPMNGVDEYPEYSSDEFLAANASWHQRRYAETKSQECRTPCSLSYSAPYGR